MLSAAAVTYTIKDQAEGEVDHIRRLRQAIQLEKDQMDVLKADWSLMTQPARLQRLTKTYEAELQLVPVEASQIAKIDDLPTKPVQIPDPSGKTLGGMADSGRDPTITGGVVQ